jgi:hypothetical protein
MAKIPRFFANPSVASRASNQLGVQVNPGQLGSLQTTGLEGAGLQELGRTVEGVSRDLTNKAEAAQNSNFMTNATTEFELNMRDRLDELGGQPDADQQFHSFFESQANDLLASAPSEETRLALTDRLNQARLGFDSILRKKQGAVNKANNLLRTNNTLDRMVQLAAKSPFEIDSISNHIGTLTDQLRKDGLSVEQAELVKQDSLKKAQGLALSNLIENEPHQAQLLLDAMEMDLDKREQIEASISRNLEDQFINKVDKEEAQQVVAQQQVLDIESGDLENVYSPEAAPEDIAQILPELKVGDREDYIKNVRKPLPVKVQESNKEVVLNSLLVEDVDVEIDNLKDMRAKDLISGSDYGKSLGILNIEKEALGDGQYRLMKSQLLKDLPDNLPEDLKDYALASLKSSSLMPESSQQIVRNVKEMEKNRIIKAVDQGPLNIRAQDDAVESKDKLRRSLKRRAINPYDAYALLRNINILDTEGAV